jgi:hypothetical protein
MANMKGIRAPDLMGGIMSRINWQRLFVGGLLAGFVANLLQFAVNRLYLFRAWDLAREMSPLPMAAGTGNHFLLAFMTFAGSFFAVWLYAMLLFRLGSGPRTSAIAGGRYRLMSWLFPVVLWTLSGPFPALPSSLSATHLFTYLGIAVAATMLGASCYKDHASPELTQPSEI